MTTVWLIASEVENLGVVTSLAGDVVPDMIRAHFRTVMEEDQAASRETYTLAGVVHHLPEGDEWPSWDVLAIPDADPEEGSDWPWQTYYAEPLELRGDLEHPTEVAGRCPLGDDCPCWSEGYADGRDDARGARAPGDEGHRSQEIGTTDGPR